jgi:hypothetical protein
MNKVFLKTFHTVYLPNEIYCWIMSYLHKKLNYLDELQDIISQWEVTADRAKYLKYFPKFAIKWYNYDISDDNFEVNQSINFTEWCNVSKQTWHEEKNNQPFNFNEFEKYMYGKEHINKIYMLDLHMHLRLYTFSIINRYRHRVMNDFI